MRGGGREGEGGGGGEFKKGTGGGGYFTNFCVCRVSPFGAAAARTPNMCSFLGDLVSPNPKGAEKGGGSSRP